MRKIANLLLITILLGSSVANAQKKKSSKDSEKAGSAETEHLVQISTDYGDMKVKLYNQTNLYRDNFLKLAGAGFFDSLLFHRVIKGFMIQGGDPDSKHAAAGVGLGGGDVGYTIPAQFNDSLYHKKGALCAARRETPDKAGSGCQFYIVQGKTVTDAELDQFEQNINQGVRPQFLFQEIINRPENAALKEQFTRYQQGNQRDSLNALVTSTIQPMINKELKTFKYSEQQRTMYKTVGGTPMLDQNYAVFGEVIEGLDVVDKIAAVQTANGDRPVTDVRMKIKVIK